MAIELVTTDGIFALDGGEWEVTNNIWLVGDDREVIVIDAAHDAAPIVDAVNGRRVRAIVLTHGHNDHINAAVPLREIGRRTDPAAPRRPDAVGRRLARRRARPRIVAGRVITAGGHELGVLHTPGHSPGCCCFHDVASDGVVFSGDTLFCGGPGATGRSYSDEPTIVRSIRDLLLRLPDETIVHTGHGESTTIGAERAGVLDTVRRARPLRPSPGPPGGGPPAPHRARVGLGSGRDEP